jgi:predicted Zn-dependent peptidase
MQQNIEITTLPNDLAVITDAMPTVATASLGFWLGVGARHEPADSNGVAHIVEHMLFKGTPTRSVFQIATALEDVGALMNAHTGKEETAYYCKLLAADAQRGIDIYSDMLLRSTLPDDELVRERGVIVQELNQTYDDPEHYLYDMFNRELYADQLYGRPTIGDANEIAVMPRDRLEKYIGANYHTGNTIFVAAGNVQHKQIVDWVHEYARDIKAGTPAPFTAPRFTPAQVTFERDIEQIHLMLTMPCASATDADYQTVNLFSQIMGGGMSSRLFTEVREKRGLVYQVNTFTVQYRDAGTFSVYACATPDKVGEVWRVVAGEMARVAATLTDEEINRAKAQMKSQLLMGLESTGRRADAIGGQWHTYGRIIPLSETLAQIEAITKADVIRIAETLRKGPVGTGMCGPMTELKDMPDVAARLAV